MSFLCIFPEVRSNDGYKHQKNPWMRIWTFRHESTYIIIFSQDIMCPWITTKYKILLPRHRASWRLRCGDDVPIDGATLQMTLQLTSQHWCFYKLNPAWWRTLISMNWVHDGSCDDFVAPSLYVNQRRMIVKVNTTNRISITLEVTCHNCHSKKKPSKYVMQIAAICFGLHMFILCVTREGSSWIYIVQDVTSHVP